jgi:hypothetical protein
MLVFLFFFFRLISPEMLLFTVLSSDILTSGQPILVSLFYYNIFYIISKFYECVPWNK